MKHKSTIRHCTVILNTQRNEISLPILFMCLLYLQMASTIRKGRRMAAEEKDENDTEHIISGVIFCRTCPGNNLTSVYQEEN